MAGDHFCLRVYMSRSCTRATIGTGPNHAFRKERSMIRGSASDSGSPQRVSPLLTVKEAAEYLSISERTLWELDARGEVQRTVIGKHSVRYHIDDLNAYITKQRR